MTPLNKHDRKKEAKLHFMATTLESLHECEMELQCTIDVIGSVARNPQQI